jgi:hypothetical protein
MDTVWTPYCYDDLIRQKVAAEDISWPGYNCKSQRPSTLSPAQDFVDRIRESASLVAQHSGISSFAKFIFQQIEVAKESHQAFWRLYDFLQSDLHFADSSFSDIIFVPRGPIGWTTEGQKDQATHTRQLSLSARERAFVLEILRNALDEGLRAHKLSSLTLKDLFVREVRKLAKVRIVTVLGHEAENLPSTHRWVHGFVLWTGISPPVFVIEKVSDSKIFNTLRHRGVHDVSYFRPGISRNRGGPFNGRPLKISGQRCLRPYSSITRSAQSNRRQRLRDYQSSWKRSIFHSRDWEMGHQLRVRS